MADGEIYMLFAYDDYYPGGGIGDLACDPFEAASDEDAIGFAQRTRATSRHSRTDNWELIAVKPGATREVWQGLGVAGATDAG